MSNKSNSHFHLGYDEEPLTRAGTYRSDYSMHKVSHNQLLGKDARAALRQHHFDLGEHIESTPLSTNHDTFVAHVGCHKAVLAESMRLDSRMSHFDIGDKEDIVLPVIRRHFSHIPILRVKCPETPIVTIEEESRSFETESRTSYVYHCGNHQATLSQSAKKDLRQSHLSLCSFPDVGDRICSEFASSYTRMPLESMAAKRGAIAELKRELSKSHVLIE